MTTATKVRAQAEQAKADADAACAAWLYCTDAALKPVLLAQFLAADTVFAMLEPLLKEGKR
jgi:hypothetical protein